MHETKTTRMVTPDNVKSGDMVAFMIGSPERKNDRRALSGNVVRVGDESVLVEIINYEQRRDKKEVGKRYTVRYGTSSLQHLGAK